MFKQTESQCFNDKWNICNWCVCVYAISFSYKKNILCKSRLKF